MRPTASASARLLARVLLTAGLSAALGAGVLTPAPAAAHAPVHANAPVHVDAPVTRVVAPGGDDRAPGTAERPWRTVRHGLRSVQPGQQLLLRGGTYTEDLSAVLYRDRATSASAPIRVAAWPGEQPVISGQLHIRDASHWTFEGLRVRWPTSPAAPGEPLVKLMGGSGWTFTRNEVSGAVAYAGVYVGVSGDTGAPRDWAITDSCVFDTRKSRSDAFTDHNVYVQNGLGAGRGRIEGNLLFGAPNGTNIKLGSGSASASPSASNVTVRYNTLYDATQNLLVEHDVHDVLIERNVIGRVTAKTREYGNLRGNGARGARVVARDNVAWSAVRFIFNTSENQTTPASSGIADGGGNRFGLDPRLDGVAGCGQFRPREPRALAYGHRARVQRVAGPDRVLTAVELSRLVRPAGGAATAVVARADAYPDALAGAPLAHRLDAPLLLTSRDRLDGAVAAELDRLGVRDVVVLGGAGAVDEAVVRALRARPGVDSVRRIAGTDRFDTARLIAAEVGGSEVYVVEGASADPARGWPDAVSVSALAARQGRPILLVTAQTLPAGTEVALRELAPGRAVVVGGAASVSAAVEAAVSAAMGGGSSVTRVAGRSRYDTSLALAELALADGARGASVLLATGGNWPDALAAGPAASATGGLLVLVPGTSPAAAAEAAALLGRVVPQGAVPWITGGRGAITNPVEDVLAAAVPAR